MTTWVDVVARVRGLSGRLLGRDRLASLAAAPSLRAVAGGVEDVTGPLPDEAYLEAAALERHLRRAAADRLRVLGRWCGPRVPLLASLFEEEDVRSIGAIARGILGAAPLEQRTSGLLPTPSLPLAALEELARQETLARMAALLVAWGNPYGACILTEARRARPDVFAIQLALDCTYAERAVASARHAGEPLLHHTHLQIDAANAWTAVAIASGRAERDHDALYVAGGENLSRKQFAEVASAADRSIAQERLNRVARGTPLEAIARAPTRGAPEDELLKASIAPLRRLARAEPLGLATILLYFLRLRAELRDLGRIVWGIALEVPSAQLAQALVSP